MPFFYYHSKITITFQIIFSFYFLTQFHNFPAASSKWVALRWA